MKNPKKLVATLAKLAISIAFFWLLFRNVDLSALGTRVSTASPVIVLAAFLTLALHTAPIAWRFAAIAASYAEPLSLWRSWRLYMIGLTFNQILPTGIGGDVIRIALLTRWKWQWRKALGAIVLDRLFGLIVVAGAFALGVFILADASRLLIGGAGVVVAALLIVAGRYAFANRKGVLEWAERHAFTTKLAQDIRSLFATNLTMRAAAMIVLYTLAAHLVVVVSVQLLAWSMGIEASFVACFLAVSAATLAAAAPVSIAGWGVREAAMAGVLASFGAAQSDALLLALGFSVGLLVLGALGAPLAFWGANAKSAPVSELYE